ncbi:antirestriction protein [Alteromonadaceae bacterium 2753L.S.0a.02]|nr:antirestriction protein [Alteromonadaceae bacterium 2753L.S.0a.02]
MCEPRIYVADLAAYNNGKLHGVWIDASLDLEDIQDAVLKMLKSSPEPDAEEWAIHDFEGFGSHRLSEYDSFERVSELAQFIEEHEELGAELISHFCGDIEEARKAIEEQYAGCHKSVADFAEELTEGTTEIPESLARYIDYKAMAYDLEVSGDIFTLELAFEEVHIFWSR